MDTENAGGAYSLIRRYNNPGPAPVREDVEGRFRAAVPPRPELALV